MAQQQWRKVDNKKTEFIPDGAYESHRWISAFSFILVNNVKCWYLLFDSWEPVMTFPESLFTSAGKVLMINNWPTECRVKLTILLLLAGVQRLNYVSLGIAHLYTAWKNSRLQYIVKICSALSFSCFTALLLLSFCLGHSKRILWIIYLCDIVLTNITVEIANILASVFIGPLYVELATV